MMKWIATFGTNWHFRKVVILWANYVREKGKKQPVKIRVIFFSLLRYSTTKSHHKGHFQTGLRDSTIEEHLMCWQIRRKLQSRRTIYIASNNLDEAHGLIPIVQGLKLDSEKYGAAID